MEATLGRLHAVFDPLEGDVDQLHDVEQQGDQGDHQHEQDEHRLLGGPRQEAVDLVRTGEALALVARRHAEAVDVPLEQQEAHLYTHGNTHTHNYCNILYIYTYIHIYVYTYIHIYTCTYVNT